MIDIEWKEEYIYNYFIEKLRGGILVSILQDKLMDALEALKPKQAFSLDNNLVYASGCGCTGNCGQSCSGGCLAGCTGNCGRSCSGRCS